MDGEILVRAIGLGIFASFFFAFTFVLNRLMSLQGGSFLWSASLRYLFMLPLLFLLVAAKRQLRPLFAEMKQKPGAWATWSFVGFGLFYVPLCYASIYSPAWLVAGTWQVTVIAGPLLSILTKRRAGDALQLHWKGNHQAITFRELSPTILILLGVAVMTLTQVTHVSVSVFLQGFVPVLIASFAYPLGNRKMMETCEGRLNAYQRTLGMTIASLPLWIALALIQWRQAGPPPNAQVIQGLIVALFSGVIATVLFFSATDLARNHPKKLASVEATQAGEVFFTVLGEKWLIPGTWLTLWNAIGLCFVVLGMILHSVSVSLKKISNP